MGEGMRMAGTERLQDVVIARRRPYHPAAERRTNPYSYVLGARRRQNKEEGAKGGMVE